MGSIIYYVYYSARGFILILRGECFRRELSAIHLSACASECRRSGFSVIRLVVNDIQDGLSGSHWVLRAIHYCLNSFECVGVFLCLLMVLGSYSLPSSGHRKFIANPITHSNIASQLA